MASVSPHRFAWVTRADGTRYKRAERGTRWRARWRTPEGESREQWFDTEADARIHLTSVEHRKLAGDYVDRGAGQVTLQSYGEQWRTIQVHRPSTAAQVRTNLERHVYPHLGHRPIGQVRPSEVQAWVKARSEHLAPATVGTIYSYLAAIFKAAVADRVITATPCVKIRLPKVEPRKVQPMTVEQFELLVGALPARFRALAVVAAGTGMRQGELFGLTVDRVDFLRRAITVDRQLVMVNGGTPTFGPPKTERSHRTIPVPALVVDAMSAHLAEYGEGEHRLIFTNTAGGPLRRPRFSDEWRPAAKAAGLEAGTGMHALRHFYASALIRHGESVKVVQERLGHATAAETLDTYSHLWPDSEDKTRAAIEAVLGRGVGSSWGAASSEG